MIYVLLPRMANLTVSRLSQALVHARVNQRILILAYKTLILENDHDTAI